MGTKESILLKRIAFILIVILPSIDYFNNYTNVSIIDALIRWISLSFWLLAIWYLNIFISNYKSLYIFIINMAFIGLLIFVSIMLNAPFFSRIFLPTILFVTIQQSFKAIEDRRTLISENLILKVETYKTELDNLRNQIKPHFLFNSLTTLQSLIRQNPIAAEDYLIKLSDFYRRTLLSSKAKKVMLKEELDFIKSYVFLLESRFENGLKITIETNKNSLQYNLPIFALQLLIENCIKHNIVSNQTPLLIHISQKEETSIIVVNNLQPKLKKENSTQTGLSNLVKYYELLGITDGLVITQNKTQFSVTLKLF